MKKFLTKPKDAHAAVKTTARDRLRSYPKGTLHEDDEGKEVYCVAVFGSKLHLKKEVNRPSVSEKLYMFFLSLETSTVAFRTVLDELLCFFLALNLTSCKIFVRNLSFLLSCLLFNEKLPRKFPRKSREIGRFLREFVFLNPVKFHFFSRELSEALVVSAVSTPTLTPSPDFRLVRCNFLMFIFYYISKKFILLCER